jgi:quercetin dioxygenase-like cupin family protein
MHVLEFGRDRAAAIERFSSEGASSVPLARGRGEAHVYAVHIDPGGSIGHHRAGVGQLFIVVSGAGWAEGDDGVRVDLTEGQAVCFARGEMHAKGSDQGMTALMVQVDDLQPHG